MSKHVKSVNFYAAAQATDAVGDVKDGRDIDSVQVRHPGKPGISPAVIALISFISAAIFAGLALWAMVE